MDLNRLRLKHDGIQEAVCELRFETTLSPEIVIGRLSDVPAWAHRKPTRLPTADIPDQLRKTEETLRYAPSYQLDSLDSGDFIRIGPNSVSCHRLAPYPGWEQFEPTILEMAQSLFSAMPPARISRVGLRYINALTAGKHFVGSVNDLNVTVTSGTHNAIEQFLLVYSSDVSDRHRGQITIATPQFVQAPDGERFDILIDVDMATPNQVDFNGFTGFPDWIEIAHDQLKKEFFSLIPSNVIDKLKG